MNETWFCSVSATKQYKIGYLNRQKQNEIAEILNKPGISGNKPKYSVSYHVVMDGDL